MSGVLAVPGYKITGFISNHANMVVYRGIRTEDNLPVFLKTPRDGHATRESSLRLRHEYRILQSLQSDSVAREVALLKNNRETTLVTEDHGGIPLTLFIKMKELSIKETLSIAIEIARCIDDIHQQEVIHKDINPSHILIHPETLEIKLINFGIATRLSQEFHSVMNPREIEGNLRYASPEQTGRMNRVVDYRTDMYSLGVTLYEMLTGRLPFTTDDILELVHAHMARMPIPPHQINPFVPQALSAIVMKCLSKNAEDRYLSMIGMIADLKHCQAQLLETGMIQPFQLARSDRAARLNIPEKLYGREQEIKQLTEVYEQVGEGASRLVLLRGNAGVGKSALVLEVQKAFMLGRGRFISGKFDQFKQSTPYSAIILALQELIRQLLSEQESALDQCREKILEALQGMGQVIVDVIPQLATIIGDQSPVPELPPAEAKNRFQMVMQRFIRMWARPEHPLILFLDDLQWADSDSLSMLQAIMNDLKITHFLLIAAYRPYEEGAVHPLVEMLAQSGSYVSRTHELHLQPLDIRALNHLLVDSLHAQPEETAALAQVVMKKTEGNPLFARQFIKSLPELSLLHYVNEEGRWEWNLHEIEKQGTADNVAGFLVGKVKQLPVGTQKLLAYAACLGNSFFLQMVAKARNQSEAEAVRHIWPALQEGLLYAWEGEKYLAYAELNEEDQTGHMQIRFSFVHDRIQQAAYSLLSDVERSMVHLRLGRMMQELPNSYESDLLFEICDHMYRGAELIEDKAERIQAAYCHLRAGKRAIASTAFDAALKYTRQGMEILPDDSWDTNHHLSIELGTLRAEAEYLCNHFSDAEALFALVLQRAKTNAERVRVLEIQIRMYTTLAKFPLVLDIANQALHLLGVHIPKKPGKLDVLKEMLQVRHRLKGRKVEQLLYMSQVPEENYKMAMKIISYAGPSSYFVNLNWFALTILRVLNLSLVHGNAVDSANGYTGYGIVQGMQFGKYQEAFEFGQLACSVAETFNDPLAMTKAYGAFAILINHWRAHARTNIPLLKKAIQYGLNSGGNIYVAYNAHGLLETMVFCGMPLEELEQRIEQYSDLIRQLKVVDHDDRLLLLQQALHCLVQRQEDKTAFVADGFDEDAYVAGLQTDGTNYKRYMYHFYKSMIHLFFGNYQMAAKLSTEAEQWIESVSGQILMAQHVFMQTLSMAAIFPDVDSRQKRTYAKRIKANLKKMKTWADNCPDNFMHQYMLMSAEWMRASGDQQQAAPLYEQAIQLARKDGFVQNEALACEFAAKHYLDSGMETVAAVYMSEARDAYLQWGALAKAREIEEKHPRVLQGSRNNQSAGEIAAAKQAPDMLDLMTVIKASQTMASEIKLEKLLATMLRTVMSNAGADKGILILKNEGEWLIEAAGTVDRDVEIMQSVPYEHSGMLSEFIVNYVIRSEEMLVLHEAATAGAFAKDGYMYTYKPQSILCSPLWQQGKMIGVIYLENKVATHAFNQERTELLRLIFSQIAIFIENARLYHQLEQWNQSLEENVRERTIEIQQLLQANKALLNNAGQGFLSFSRGLQVHSEYSRECLRLFGKEIEGVSVAELLYPDSEDDRMFIESLMEKYFEAEEGELKGLYLSLFPTEIMIQHRPVKLECKPIHDPKGGLLDGLMLIMTDLSEKRALESKMEQEWHILKMVVTVATSVELFHGVLRQFLAFFGGEWQSIFHEEGSFLEKLGKMKARIHHFKGDLSQFHLVHTPAELHEMETELSGLGRRQDSERLRAITESHLERVQLAMQQDLALMRKSLGHHFLERNEQAITFSKDRWGQFEAKLADYLEGNLDRYEELVHHFRKLHYRPFSELVERYTDTVAQMAERLGKRAQPLRIEADDIWVDPQRFGNFVRSLIHVFRNAIDHGIEPEQERLARNKSQAGTVSCDIRKSGEKIQVTISDDGRGIALEQIKNISRKKGWQELDNDEEWLTYIFMDDISVKEEVNEMSGRGMGLSIVKREVELLGGEVEVRTAAGLGTSFSFTLPCE